MATEIVITGVAGYDGAYTLDLADQPLDTFEWGWIKKYAGYLPTDELQFGDPEFVVTLATICLSRAGKIERRDVRETWETLARAPFGQTITLRGVEEADEEDGEPGPPQSSSNSKTDTSGPGSSSSSETSDETRDSSGTPGSDGPALVRVRSVS
jgi:hypothetical protein